MTLDDLAELSAAYEAATKGELVRTNDGLRNAFVECNGVVLAFSSRALADQSDSDIDFVALAHNRFPELLRLASEVLAKGTP